MALVKQIVCLANSRKMSGRCIAGKELLPGGVGPWVRPVSDRPLEELNDRERKYQGGGDPQLLDVIAVPLREPRPNRYQTENWLLDPARRWPRAGCVPWAELHGYADHPATLWLNGEKTLAGLNARLRLASAEGLRNSLYLLHLDGLKLRVFAPGAEFGNPLRRLYGDFEHQGVRYVLRVTDPVIEMKYLVGEDGDLPVGECFITVSLGEPHEGYCYKLVAAVISE